MKALAYKRGSRAVKAKILDELVPSPGGTVTTPESAAGPSSSRCSGTLSRVRHAREPWFRPSPHLRQVFRQPA